jgi:hypothetical protein
LANSSQSSRMSASGALVELALSVKSRSCTICNRLLPGRHETIAEVACPGSSVSAYLKCYWRWVVRHK